jgi:tRNA(Ile)-lysidine synthase
VKAIPLLTQVTENLDGHELFRPRQAILVAVSGGVDSVVLLHLLNQLAPAHEWKLTVAHFNHLLRGRSSDADESFVRNLAKKLKLPFIAGRADVRKFAIAEKLSVEMAGRKLRHEFFAKTAARRKIPSVALAHQADDQVELFFLRLLRGTGGAGLAGMDSKSPSPANPKIQLVRPLLNQSKVALEQFAKEQGLEYREDASNASLDFQRNRIRHELIPLLQKNYQPALSRVVLRLMEILRGESDRGGDSAKKVSFAKLPVAWQRRKIRAELKRHQISPEFELIEKLRKTSGQAVMVPGGKTVQRQASGRLTVPESSTAGFATGGQRVRLRGRAGQIALENVVIQWERIRASRGTFSAPKAVAGQECFDAEKLGSELFLRHWQPGDRFQPIGLAKSVKLQDLFTNQKIPRQQRHKLLVGTTRAGEVFWVEGLRIGEGFRLETGSRYRLKWRWKRL